MESDSVNVKVRHFCSCDYVTEYVPIVEWGME